MILHKQRALKDLEDGLVMDIRIREVDEYTWLSVTVGIDVEVVSSPGDTSSYILTVVLEIHREESEVTLVASDTLFPTGMKWK